MEALLTGIAAGYGIAIPVGAIAILIVEVGIRCGFRCGFAAGAGAATADLIYAALAVVGGAGLAVLVEGIERPLRVVSALILALIAITGLLRIRRQPETVEMSFDRRELAATYGRFLGLTLVNPTTVIYFVAVIVGLGVVNEMSPTQGALFVFGAFAASLSWQTLLAILGAFAGNRLGDRVRMVAIVVGNLVILALAVVILIP